MKYNAQSLIGLSVFAISLVGFQSVSAIEQTAAKTATAWKLDPAHTSVRFTIQHMMVSKVPGAFAKVSGTAKYDGKDLKNASADATIDTTSINTNEEHRDAHLKSPDFFDVAKFPTITFKSSKVTPEANGNFKLTGALTMHGVTKDVTLDCEKLATPVKDAKGHLHSGTSATTTINRKDFGLTFNKALDNGGTMLGDDVKVNIDVELVEAEDEKAKS
ncbi:MAG: YceI family protein [Candidatus Obscuribacterales bacterium]|nr:YceI family protein [Candidatus Obscuribacterales bacterium]